MRAAHGGKRQNKPSRCPKADAPRNRACRTPPATARPTAKATAAAACSRLCIHRPSSRPPSPANAAGRSDPIGPDSTLGAAVPAHRAPDKLRRCSSPSGGLTMTKSSGRTPCNALHSLAAPAADGRRRQPRKTARRCRARPPAPQAAPAANRAATPSSPAAARPPRRSIRRPNRPPPESRFTSSIRAPHWHPLRSRNSSSARTTRLSLPVGIVVRLRRRPDRHNTRARSRYNRARPAIRLAAACGVIVSESASRMGTMSVSSS